MITLLIVAALSCPDTKIENWTRVWNKQDQTTLEGARAHCAEVYPRSNPCLKMFRKKDATTYNAVCGAENDKTDQDDQPNQDDIETDYA